MTCFLHKSSIRVLPLTPKNLRQSLISSSILPSPPRRFVSRMAHEGPGRFRPLSAGAAADADDGLPVLRGVVFDVDGTLCLPQNYMFGQMRDALQITKATDILDHIYALPPTAQAPAMDAIKAIERAAMAHQQPQPGLVELMDYLGSKGLRKGICTRNFDGPVTHLLTTFLPDHQFAPVITRAFRPPKPHPAGILHIAATWAREDAWPASDHPPPPMPGPDAAPPPSTHASAAVPSVAGAVDVSAGTRNAAREAGVAAEDAVVTSAAVGWGSDPGTVARGPRIPIIMVGDSVDDLVAGWRAGAATVLLVSGATEHLRGHWGADLVVERLDELVGVLERGFVGR